MSRRNAWKKREGVVYSTDPEFEYTLSHDTEPETLPPEQQQLYVSLDKSGRAGKQVTLISGFVGTRADLQELGKQLKTRCGTGGSVKGGQIIIQGDFRLQVFDWLAANGYRVKRKG